MIKKLVLALLVIMAAALLVYTVLPSVLHISAVEALADPGGNHGSK